MRIFRMIIRFFVSIRVKFLLLVEETRLNAQLESIRKLENSLIRSAEGVYNEEGEEIWKEFVIRHCGRDVVQAWQDHFNEMERIRKLLV